MDDEFEFLGIHTAQEASELIKAVTKAQQYGLESRNPLVPNSPTNREEIEEEAADTIAMIDMMGEAGIINRQRVNDLVPAKKFKKQQSLRLQRALRAHNFDHSHPEVVNVFDELFKPSRN